MPDGLSEGRSGGSGAALPFLPTLATALCLAALSFLCQGGDRPAVAPVPVVDAQAFHPASPAEAAIGAGPAALAFAQVYPLAPAEPRALASLPRPARLAAMPPRRAARRPEPKPAFPAAEAAPAEPLPFAEAAEASPVSEPFAEPFADLQAEVTGALPAVALPFAPAARAYEQAVGYVRTGASALGGSVSVLVDRLR